MGGYAWVTLATNDSYSLGALVLAHSLKKSKTAHKSVVLITPAVSQSMREQLQAVFDVIKVVDVLDSKDEAHLALMQRPELGITFTKIHCWRLVEFDKCVFLDADTLVVRNCDELFEREEFSAAPDVSWPDCFNSGVFVYKPSVETFNKLLQFAVERGSFDGGDQGLLNQFFRDWATEDIKKHLPFVYNLTSVAAYSYIPAFKHYGSETRIVHFIGSGKPWLQQLDPSTRSITPTSGSEHLAPLLQKWWDLFCEEVHPNLNKNLWNLMRPIIEKRCSYWSDIRSHFGFLTHPESKLEGESNNDGMSHPPVEACSNTLPIALTDDSQTPRLIEPCTPYREKDDLRQYNLPYQPFDVMGSSGVLLNVEFLLASVVHPTQSEVCLNAQQRREGEEKEEKDGGEKRDQKEEKDDPDVKGNESRGETESLENTRSANHDFRTEEGEQQQLGQERKEQEHPAESEQPPPPSDPFDYDSFFPDETCINNYLEQNVMTYQPYESLLHCQQQQQIESHHPEQLENSYQNSFENSSQYSNENNSKVNLTTNDLQPPEESVPSLPRFLTIPESDRRQSGNTETHSQTKQFDHKSCPPSEDPAIQGSPQPPPRRQQVGERRELTKSKSMPYLKYDVTEVPSTRSIWKSQPNVNVDPNRKYSMPKLKPILPRQNSLSKSVPSVMPKVTLYTEFLMSSEYKDPVDLPKDKVGFVEALIHKKGQLKRSKSAADIADKFGPLPYTPSPEIEQPAALKKMPLRHLDNELYDFSQCKRQMGNKPKVKVADRSKENNHSLPPLKPLVPPKDKKSTLIKKRKSKELSPGDGGKEKILRRAPKMLKERKLECKIYPRNVSETENGNNVDEILKRLREFSRNYQHFFGVVPQHRVGTIQCKNTTVQVSEQSGEWDTSEGFSKAFSSAKAIVSRGTQTPIEERSERLGSAADSEFRNFRNYVKDKSKTTQKGLLGIQDLVSEPGAGEDEVTEGEESDNCSVLRIGSEERVLKRKVHNMVDCGVKREGKLEDVALAARKSPVKGGMSFNHESSSKWHEIAEGDRKLSKTGHTGYTGTPVYDGDSNRTVESVPHSTWQESKEVGTDSPVKSFATSSASPANESKSKATVSDHSQADIPESQTLPTKDAVLSFNEKEVRTKRLGGNHPGRHAREVTGSSVSLNFEYRMDKMKTNSTPTSHSNRITTNENGGSKVFSDAAETPAKQDYNHRTRTEKQLLEGTLSEKLSPGKAPVAADTSSPANISRGCHQSNPHGKYRIQEKALSGFGIGDQPEGGSLEEVKQQNEILCVPDFDTPRSSRMVLPTSKTVTIEVIEEMIAKASLINSQTSAPQRPTPPKTHKHKSSPDKVSGTHLAKSNSPPNDTPDGTAPPAEGEPCAAAQQPSSPSSRTPRNGNALPDCHEDVKLSSGIAGAIAQLSLEAGSDQSYESAAAASTAHQEYIRRQNWESGNMDYMGRDSFDNIWSKICQTLEGKELEAGPAAVSPKQITESLDSSMTVSLEEARKGELPPVSLSVALQKCPEYIETLPGEPGTGRVEDDEIIFSKPDNRQLCLTNITEEDVRTEGSFLEAKALEPGKVKLSDILQPETSSSAPKENNRTDTAGEPGKCESVANVGEGKAPLQKVTQDKLEAQSGERSENQQEKPEEIKPQPEGEEVQCQTVAVCQPLFPSQHVPPGGGANALRTSEKSECEETERKVEECTTVAIPTPPITFPGVPVSEKDKMQSKRRPEKGKEKFDPIPLPPPESPTLAPGPDAAAAKTSTSDSTKEEGKQRKGVFTKILEMVGVSPKEKNGEEMSKSIFYDGERSATSVVEPTENENVTAAESKKAPTAEIDNKEISQKQTEDAGKDVRGQTQEIKKYIEKVPTSQSREAGVLKPGETKEEIIAVPPEVGEAEKTAEEKAPTIEPTKSCGEPKPPIEKPARNTTPNEPKELPKDTTQVPLKSKSPGPKLTLPQKPPETDITMPTPPPQPDVPVRKNSALLKVDETVLQTPPVFESPPSEETNESVKGRVLTEVEDIIGKVKNEVESRLQDLRTAEKEPGESFDLINTMKQMVGSEQAEEAPSQSPEVEVEELRVTTEEERMRHKGEMVSSKLSDQILKAIPPPRRKAISEGSASASAIPKPSSSTPDQKNIAGEMKPKMSKPSSIPVPPPRNRGKPTQPTPSKSKGKK